MAIDIEALEKKAYGRRLEELCEQQDRAISALKNALEATQLALDIIERNRAEQGYKQQIDWGQLQPWKQQYYPLSPIYQTQTYPQSTTYGGLLGTYCGSQQANIQAAQQLSGVDVKVDWTGKDVGKDIAEF